MLQICKELERRSKSYVFHNVAPETTNDLWDILLVSHHLSIHSVTQLRAWSADEL